MNISRRSILVVAGPVAGALLFGSIAAVSSWHTRQEARSLASLSGMMAGAGALIHELQNERGMTATLVASGGQSFRAELPGQRAAVDTALASFRQAQAGLDPHGFATGLADRLSAQIVETGRALDKVAELRPAADQGALTPPAVVETYSTAIGNLITMTTLAKRAVASPEVASIADTLQAVTVAKEAAGKERAAGAAALARPPVSVEDVTRLAELAGRQHTAIEEAQANAAGSDAQALRDFGESAEARKVAELRRTFPAALSGNAAAQPSSEEWFQAASRRIEKLRTLESSLASRLIAAASAEESAAQFAFLATLAGILVVLVGSAAASMMLSRGLIRSLRGLRDAMAGLAGGDLDVAIPGLGQLDEVGEMAAAVKQFKDNALRVRHLEESDRAAAAARMARMDAMAAIVAEVGQVVERVAQGEFASRVSAHTDDEHLRKLIDGINAISATIERAVDDFSDVLTAVSKGDLSRSVETAYAGHLDHLKTAVNRTIENLADTVAAIQATAGEVAGAAREISAGADDLSRRTEDQASSLEETAATTEELAASVKATAQSAREAVELAEQAMGVAETGGTVVSQAGEAMARIEQASRKISDITSVIDDIAFQTNLLALNAAVEAARAGDAGKGFAVVASEVRTLAQRSGAAAKDISGLIERSSAEVAQGVQLVRSAGAALEKIVGASKRVTSTVSEISAASSEQANGIDEMSQAVSHLDEMTQQNAALAEESAASANTLLGQIERLNETVAQFRTSRTAKASVPAPARPATRNPTVPERLRSMAAAAFSRPAKAAAGGGSAKASSAGWEEF
jgi:methyl-accepting chemotaxis protein